MSFLTIRARELSLSRTTIYKYLEVSTPGRVEATPRRQPVLDAVSPRIDTLVAEWHSQTTAKQRLTAARIHRQLLSEATVLVVKGSGLFFSRVAKSAGVSSSQAARAMILDHGESADAGFVADGASPVPAVALARP